MDNTQDKRHHIDRGGLATTASPGRQGVVTNGEPQPDKTVAQPKKPLKRGDMLL